MSYAPSDITSRVGPLPGSVVEAPDVAQAVASPAAQVRVFVETTDVAQPGDIVFGNRLSPVQRWNTVTGDSLTHSGLLIERDGELVVVELGASGCFIRTLADFRAAYRVTAIARTPLSDECRRRVVAHAATLPYTDAVVYSWRNVFAAGLVTFARRVVPDRWQPALLRRVRTFGAAVKRQMPSNGMTCSGLVLACLDHACVDCWPDVVWPTRRRDRPWRGCTTPTDARFAAVDGAEPGEVANALFTPSDLWATAAIVERFVMYPDHSVLLIDADRAADRVADGGARRCANAFATAERR